MIYVIVNIKSLVTVIFRDAPIANFGADRRNQYRPVAAPEYLCWVIYGRANPYSGGAQVSICNVITYTLYRSPNATREVQMMSLSQSKLNCLK